MADKYIPTVLPRVDGVDAAIKAKETIERERQGKQLGLKVRWNGLNIANRKYFRFKQIYLLAGLSGHGKSFLDNIILNDFMDLKNINKDYKGKPLVLYFCYEMTAEDELIRTLSTKMNVSYNRILSSEWDSTTKTYEGLTEKELETAFSHLHSIGNRPMFYFETAGNLLQLEATVKHYDDLYKKERDIIVAIDHTLLSEKLTEKTELELMANTGKTAVRLKKKHNAMVLMLGQLNNNIEDFKRITNPRGHYPIKSDIYAAGQIYNACDTVMTIHQPALLKISNYGEKKMNTKNLVHLQILKARHGHVGSIFLENRLNEGTLLEINTKKVDDVPI